MPVIYCTLDMFALTQPIRIINDDGSVVATVYSTTADLPQTIAHICKEKNISNIHFYGNENYLNQIATDVQTNYNLHYHCGNPLTIEVN